MVRDAIVEEVRRARHATEEANGKDWKRLTEHYRRIKPAGARIISRQPRRLASDSATTKP